MKLALVSSLLSALAAAVPTANSASTAGQPAAFTVTAARSASPIHLLPMNAANQSFWIGSKPSTYCPLAPESCPPGNTTTFAGNGGALSVSVPGGQQIYVAPSGALKFTQAHSASTPPGSSYGPFAYEAGAQGSAFGHYTYSGWGANGFMACPAPDHKWQVFAALHNATVPSGNVDDCLGFSALATPTNQTGQTWQYV